MVFFIDEARSRPPPRLLTNVNKKMVFFIEGFPNWRLKDWKYKTIFKILTKDNCRYTLFYICFILKVK